MMSIFNLFSSTSASSSSKQKLSKFEEYSDEAYKSLSAGLDLDQNNGSLDTVIQLYRLGIKDLKSALEFKKEFDEIENLKIKSLKEKMRKTLKDTMERLDILEEKKAKESQIFDANIPGHASTKVVSAPSTIKPAPFKPLPEMPSPTKRQSSSTTLPSQRPSKAQVLSKESKVLAHQILDEILVEKPNVSWDSIVGLDQAKKALYEIVVMPYIRPELFKGLREPARGVLLFGPPGKLF